MLERASSFFELLPRICLRIRFENTRLNDADVKPLQICI